MRMAQFLHDGPDGPRLPSTASDWVTYADYVVVASPTAERPYVDGGETGRAGLGRPEDVI
jgi:hypothetical protein